MRRKALAVVAVAIISFFVFVGIGWLTLYFFDFFQKPDLSRLNDARELSVVYDESGELLKEYCAFCREVATLPEMGHFPQIAVAVEDKNFWKRDMPFDILSIARAAFQNVKAGKVVEGGSSIVQQAAKITFADKELQKEREAKDSFDRSTARWWRKAREAYFAYQLQKLLPKDKILELYLNNVYCGHGRYGVKACSFYYFGKSPLELSVAEAAMIAGTWRSPQFSPFLNPAAAKDLRSRVLRQLADESVITNDQEAQFGLLPLPARHEVSSCAAEHALEFMRRQITKERRLVDAGLRIRTTLNCDWQRAAAKALSSKIEEMKLRDPELTDLRGVAIVLDAKTGAIKVFTQEPAFSESQYLADQVKRHTGSAFKPFFYASWLQRGGRLSCDDEGTGSCLLDDSYETAGGKSALYLTLGKGKGVKSIQNFPYEGGLKAFRYRGLIPPILALAESRNVATMSGMTRISGSRVRRLVSKEDIMLLAHKLKIELPTINPETAATRGIALINSAFAKRAGLPFNVVDPGETIAIGSIDVSPLELARAFTGFMDGVVYPYITEEIDADILSEPLRAEFNEPEKVLEEKTALAIMRGLRATAEFRHGTAKRAKNELDFQICGKTGTATNNNGETTDNWFVGCTPSYVMVVWLGREERKSGMRTVELQGLDGSITRVQQTGGGNALPIFIETMKAIYLNQPKEEFPESTNPLKPFRLLPAPPSSPVGEEARESDNSAGDDF